MQLSEAEYGGMKYPIHRFDDAELFKEIPLLKIIWEETCTYDAPASLLNHITKYQLMKYMVLVYHRHSPLAGRIADIIRRKKTALEAVGIDLAKLDKNPTAKSVIQEVILSQNSFCNHLSLNFLKNENNLKWVQLVRAMEAWEDMLFQMQQDTDGTDKKSGVEIAKLKADLYKNAQIYRRDIDNISAELMREDLALQNAVSGHLFIENHLRRLITPEDYTSMTSEQREEEFKRRGFGV